MQADGQLTPEERRRLDRLERAARTEVRAREREARRHARSAGADEPILPGDAVGGPASAARPRLRKVILRLGVAAAAIMLLLVLLPPFLIPVDGQVTSRFFLRTQPESIFLFDIEQHRGLDIGAPEGTPVRAARSGRVIAVDKDPSYGLYVEIRHPLGVTTRYAHLSRQLVRDGQWVFRGRRIAEVGMTGRATGPHLHFEIRLGDRSIPPGFFLVFHSLRRAILSPG